MGYDVHITRASDWTQNKGQEITSTEWHGLIQNDEDLVPDPQNGPNAVIWNRHPGGAEDAWLDWSMGNIYTTNPDRDLLGKMLEIAARLSATVQGDDSKVYQTNEDLVL